MPRMQGGSSGAGGSGDVAAGVQNLSALRSVAAVVRADKQIRLVEDSEALYTFNTSGAGADDGDLVIVPNDITPPAPGRWFKTQAATQNHEALTGLQGGATSDHKHLTTAEYNDVIIGPAQLVRVKPGTNVIGSAVAAITDATSSKPYVILCSPGIYVEAPFSLKPYVSVIGTGSWFDTVLVTSSNSADFITGAAGAVLKSVSIVGPTGSGCAAINSVATGYVPFIVEKAVIRVGYYGLHHHPSTYGTVHAHELVNQYTGSVINKFIFAENGNVTVFLSSVMSGPPSAVLQGFVATGANTTVSMDQCAFNNAGSEGLYVDDSAVVRMSGCSFDAGVTALHLGPTGAPCLHACGNNIGGDFTHDIIVESSSAVVSYLGCGHLSKSTIPVGATVSALVVDDTSGAPAIISYGGDFVLAGPTGLLPVGDYLTATAQTGYVTGGMLTRGSGLHLNVSDGNGFVTSSIGVLTDVSWTGTSLVLPASTGAIWVVVNALGVVSYTTSQPDPSLVIVLGDTATDASSIIFLTDRTVGLYNRAANQHAYFRDVLGPINISGGTVVKHAPTSLQVDVDASSFYIANNRKSSVSASPATFTTWYRDGAGGWKVVAGVTGVSDQYYDDGSGTPALLPSGKWKRSSIYVAVSDDGTEFHGVFGQGYYDSQALALLDPTPPDILRQKACRLASLIVQRNAGDIAQIIDTRPKLGQAAPATTAVTLHNQLGGLSADDHTQYQLRTEKNSVSGYAGLDSSSKLSGSQQVYGTASNTACVGNDARLTNSRAPTAHASSHQNGGSDEVGTATAAANAIPKADGSGKLDTWVTADAIAATSSLRKLGTGATNACAGNDSRLSDSRAPTSHATSHKNGGGDEVATATPAAAAIPKADGSGKLDSWVTSAAAAGTASLRTLGTGATDACAGNDGRLTNSRTPTAHASTHQNGGGDEVATATATANSIPKTGATTTLAIGWLPTGTSSSTVCIGNDARLSDSRAPNGSASGDLAGSYPSPTVAQAANAFALPGVISPASIGADQNNYAPTGLATSSAIRLTASGLYKLTGLTGGASGRVLFVANIGTNPIVISHEDAGSTAANRFLTPNSGPCSLAANKTCLLQYDSTSSRWRVFGQADVLLGQKDVLTTLTPTNGGTVTLNYLLGNAFLIDASALTAGQTFTVAQSSWPGAGFMGTLSVIVKTPNAALGTVTWPTGFTAPTLVQNKENWYTVSSLDGTTFRMFSSGAF